MKTVLRSILAVVVMLTLTSCPPDPQIELTVSPSTLTLDNNNQGEINIISNTSWNIRSTETWLSASTTSGMGDRQVMITAINNTSDQTRSAQLVVSDKTNSETRTVTVTQRPSQSTPTPTPTPNPTTDYTLDVNKNSISFTSVAGDDYFDITADQSWTISSNQPWCTVSPASGNNNRSIKVTVSQNTNTVERNAVITVTGGDNKQKVVNITQQGATETENKPGEGDNTTPRYSRQK